MYIVATMALYMHVWSNLNDIQCTEWIEMLG